MLIFKINFAIVIELTIYKISIIIINQRIYL